jgi:hypothetical protein
MLEKCFDLVKKAVVSNEFLSNNINSYFISATQTDLSYPSLLMRDFSQKYLYTINNSIFCINVKFNLVFEFDCYDYFLISEIDRNLRKSVSILTSLDADLEIKVCLDSVKSFKENEIFKEIYQFSGTIFLKTVFFE